MLHIKCEKCGITLKGQEVKVEPFNNFIDGVKYKDYAVTCPKCGSAVLHERYAKKAHENKMEAISKTARKKGKTLTQITDEMKYNTIMREVGKRAREISISHNDSEVKYKYFDQAIKELPQDKKQFILAYEDEQDMALLNKKCTKSTDRMTVNSILLINQGIIIRALKENDKDFLSSKYGKTIVDSYNAALTLYKGCDYNITSSLLLEKIESGEISKILELLGANYDYD